VNHRFYWLDQIQAEQRSSVGKSAIYLSRLVQHCSPVQPGFIVPIDTFQDYCSASLRDSFEQTHRVLTKQEQQRSWLRHPGITQAAIQLQNCIHQHFFESNWLRALQTNMQALDSEFFLLQAFLDTDNDPDGMELWTPQIGTISDVEIALKRLWAETFCARNLRYWQHHNYLPHTIPLATFVQPLALTQSSGRLWVNSEIIGIQAIWGVGISSQPWETPNLGLIVDRTTGAIQSQQTYAQSIFHGIEGHLPFAQADPLLISGQGWLHPYSVPAGAGICLDTTKIEALIAIGQQAWKLLQKPLKLDWRFDGKKMVLQSLSPTGISEMLSHTLISQSGIDPETEFLYQTQSTDQHNTDRHNTGKHNARNIQPQPFAIGIAAAPGTVTAQAIVLSDHQVLLKQLPENRILVTTHLTPQWLPLIRQAVGIVTERGGITSHAAILARELGIPAIVGVTNATRQFHSGDWLSLKQGKIYVTEERLPDDLRHLLTSDTSLASDTSQTSNALQANVTSQAVETQPQLNTHCLAVVSQMEQVARLPHTSIDGIGLIRAEHLLLPHLQNKHPWQWLQHSSGENLSFVLSAQLEQILSTIAPLPIWYRTADWRSHELSGLAGATDFLPELNPILGIHGTASYQQFPEWLDLELSAIAMLPSHQLKHLRLLFPFVRTVEEFQFCRSRVVQAGLGQLPLWIMAEVPSVLFSLAEYVAAGVQGITIGMNDWMQLLFAIDRDHPSLSSLFNPHHPAVRQSIQQLVQRAQQLNIPCHVCSLTEDAAFVAFLVEIGVTGIAANVKDIRQLRHAIAQAESKSGIQPRI
jgi:pyruvate, water dikinase